MKWRGTEWPKLLFIKIRKGCALEYVMCKERHTLPRVLKREYIFFCHFHHCLRLQVNSFIMETKPKFPFGAPEAAVELILQDRDPGAHHPVWPWGHHPHHHALRPLQEGQAGQLAIRSKKFPTNCVNCPKRNNFSWIERADPLLCITPGGELSYLGNYWWNMVICSNLMSSW